MSIISLWSSTNGGTNWTNISGNLEQNPDGSGNGPSCRWATSVNANGTMKYFVATSTGLYSTTNLKRQRNCLGTRRTKHNWKCCLHNGIKEEMWMILLL